MIQYFTTVGRRRRKISNLIALPVNVLTEFLSGSNRSAPLIFICKIQIIVKVKQLTCFLLTFRALKTPLHTLLNKGVISYIYASFPLALALSGLISLKYFIQKLQIALNILKERETVMNIGC